MSPRFSPYSGRSSVSATRSCSLIIGISFQRIGRHQAGDVGPGIDEPNRPQVRTSAVSRRQGPFDHIPDAEGRRLFLQDTMLGGMVQEGAGEIVTVVRPIAEPAKELGLRSA